MTTISAREPESAPIAAREFWRSVLERGGFTALPRWTAAPVVGVAEYEGKIADELAAGLGRVADELGVPLRSVFLAAHAKVLAALSGDSEVVLGFAVEDAQPLPCPLTTAPASWRGLVVEAHRAESELLAHKNFPVAELRRQLGMTEMEFEAVFEPAARDGAELSDELVFSVGVIDRNGLRLRLRYRTEMFDADCASRIIGYHLAALERIAADPDAEHRRECLLSPKELRFQLEGLAGAQREMPDRRIHELFEERVRAHPDAIAAVHRDRRWTYQELNAHANRVARALLARGLRSEEVVAVVTERNLDWMAAVLATFKAGGAYLPIEPQLPADRVARMLRRAACRFALTEPSSTGVLDRARERRAGVEPLLITAAYEEGDVDADLELPVRGNQLAYVFFTSGSTGEPKGAMCEHAGMLNHLFAKIEDLRIAEGQVVAQTAPLCFDISLWQVVSALVVGARTLLVEQEAIMDPGRFLDRIAAGRVNVLQLVPSYLEVLLSYLERHPRELPDLRYVSVTGEAVKKELTQRWFEAQPGIRLMNAYGLTETSDDTNHEVMDRAPDGERVPLGRPVRNVRAYVVDEHLAPVPLGAPGEIVFSGVCVGRGYINDPERTQRVFSADPHGRGQRLYRTGDFGRWRPDDKLEYLGRRDAQVKIRGFRIEIGEIENVLAQVPGVRDGAVVIGARADGSKRLVAFYSGPRPLATSAPRDRLARSLPEYMVPSAFHWRAALPLNANGKIDRKALAALAGELAVAEHEYEEPRTASERKLTDAFANVLGIRPEQIGRQDNFFDLGGTSLSAVKLAIALNRAVSVKDLIGHPVLADLAALIDGRSQRGSGLLQSLSVPDCAPAAVLVCFPYAGGNAVNFQSMARALRGSELSVYAVEPPGHDPGAEDEPFASMTQVVDQVVDEIIRLRQKRIFLWGHSSGAAFALETARSLDRRGVSVERVFIGAQLLGNAGDRRAMVTELTSRSNAQIADWLSADGGYTELSQLDGWRALRVGAAYRHDCLCANRCLAYALEAPPTARLRTPVTVVVAADDVHTAGFRDRYRDWERVAQHVDLHELAEGGHYFLRTRPTEAAHTVLSATKSPAPNSSN